MVRTSSCSFIPFCPVNREGPAGPTDGLGPEDKDVPIGTTLFWTLARGTAFDSAGLLPNLSEVVASAWTVGTDRPVPARPAPSRLPVPCQTRGPRTPGREHRPPCRRSHDEPGRLWGAVNGSGK
jgi:hypothetical protein